MTAKTHPDELLTAFVLDQDFERLESLLSQFNLFEAIGAVRQEIRHSAMLAFLMAPHQNHGLGDFFVKRLLQHVLVKANSTAIGVSALELEVWDLDEMSVQREVDNIDILLVDERNRLVVVIENKIGSTEHTNQLQRYRKKVAEKYAGWTQIGLYLTPERDAPTDASYLPVGYGLICEIIEHLLKTRKSNLNQDVQTLLSQYVQMLRRHIVNESDIAKLCRELYKKHSQAIDLILEHRPDQRATITAWLEELVRETRGLILDDGTSTRVRFVPESWTHLAGFNSAEKWTSSKRTLLFEFVNNPQSLTLYLIIGPGAELARNKVFEMAGRSGSPFMKPAKLSPQYQTIYKRIFLEEKHYKTSTEEQLREQLNKGWNKFLEKDLPIIQPAVEECLAT